MQHSIIVDTSAVIDEVTAELYTFSQGLKSQLDKSVDDAVDCAKTEMRSETSQLVRKLDGLVVKMVEDKVGIFIGSEAVMEAVVEAVKARLAPDTVMQQKPWWKWW
jgi:hypothetical protein